MIKIAVKGYSQGAINTQVKRRFGVSTRDLLNILHETSDPLASLQALKEKNR
jgi:hypothetical protein